MTTAFPPGPAGVVFDLTSACSLLVKLKMLDQVWSTWVTKFEAAPRDGDPGRSEEFEALIAQLGLLVDGIEGTFNEFAAVSARLEPFFAHNADSLRQPIDVLVERLPEASRSGARGLFAGKGDPADAVRAACANMQATADSELTHIRAEVEKVTRGEAPAGDFSPAGEADLGLVAAGIAIVATPAAGLAFEAIVHTDLGHDIGEAVIAGVEAVGEFIVGLFS